MDTKLIAALDWVNARPVEAWYGLGIFIGSILATIGVVAWVRRHHLKKHAEKLSSRVTVMIVAFTGFLVSASQFVIDSIATNSQIFGPFIPKEWLAHATTVSMGALTVHTAATAILKWWIGRKAAPSPKTVQAIEQAAQQLPQPTTPAPISDFRTSPPSADLLTQ